MAPSRHAPTEQVHTRQRLIDGARSAVEAHGMRALTVEHCIRAAGLSRRTFYQYFRDRDDVLCALYEHVVADILQRCASAVIAESEPVAHIRAGLNAYLDVQEHGGRLIAELQSEAANPSSPLWPLRERSLDQMGEVVHGLVRHYLSVDLEPDTFRALYAGLEELVIHARQGGLLSSEKRARIAALALPIFRAVLGSAPQLAAATGGQIRAVKPT